MSRREKKKRKRKWPFILFALVVIFLLWLLIPDDEEMHIEESDGSDQSLTTTDTEDSNLTSNDYQMTIVDTINSGEYPLGTCGSIAGTTLVISLFVDDTECSWTEADNGLKQDCLKYTKIATDWITAEVAAYGCNAQFIYDWSVNEDLQISASMEYDLMNAYYYGDYADYVGGKFISDVVNTSELKAKYSADNVLYLMFVNTPSSNTSTSCTRTYYEGIAYPYEICYIYMNTEGIKEAPAGIAHEMLHTFGAPDLYMADTMGDNCGITEEYVDMLANSYSNDIMYTTYDRYTYESYYDRITNELTELDAYYCGATNHSSVVDEWGFDASKH